MRQQGTPSVPLSLSLENRAPLTIPIPERQTQWDGGSITTRSEMIRAVWFASLDESICHPLIYLQVIFCDHPAQRTTTFSKSKNLSDPSQGERRRDRLIPHCLVSTLLLPWGWSLDTSADRGCLSRNRRQVWRPSMCFFAVHLLLVLFPSTKESNYGIHIDQSSSSLIKFIVNSISIYIYK